VIEVREIHILCGVIITHDVPLIGEFQIKI